MFALRKNIPVFLFIILYSSGSLVFANEFQKGMELSHQKKYVEAFPVIEKEAIRGNAEAQFQIGKMYELGYGTKINYKKAAYWYEKSINQGNSKAKNNLAGLYLDGQGVKKDLKKAYALYSQSSKQGNEYSQFNLALMYLNGQYVKQDSKKACSLFDDAAKKGHMKSQYNLGICYSEGKAVSQDYKKALYWNKKSADQGYDKALHVMGLIYHFGEGVPIDTNEAIKWYKRAADKGFTPSMWNLSTLYLPEDNPGDAKRWDEVYKWYSMGMQHGDKKDAPFGMGLIYVMGWGNHPKDYPKASQLFTLAAENGKADGWYWLGVMEENGFGRAADKDKALELYRKAASLGSDPAIRRLNRETSGTGVMQSLKELISPLQ